MPPLIHVAVCWIVAAALGSIEPPSSSPLTLATLLALAVGVVSGVISTGDRAHAYRVAVTLGLAGISLAGVLQARAAREEALVCRTALAHVLADSGTVLAVFDDHVQARNAARSRTGESASRTRRSARVATPSVPSRSRGVVRGAAGALSRCRVPVMVAVSSGRARAGQWMSLQGTVLTTERGLRVTGAITPLAHAERDWRRAVRARTGDLIDRDFKRNAPLVRALLIADQDGIDPAVRDRFADAGLVHMLSISGLHVAIIAGSLLTLASAMRLSQTAAFGAALVVIVLYVTALGAPPPAVRSAVMLAVVGLSQRLQRPTHPWTALALGAVIPTVQPEVVLDLGWQLSVSGMAALVAARALLRRLRLAEAREHPPRLRRALRWLQGLSGWRYTAVRELVTGVVATLVTAPLIAWTFGRVSVVAPLSNIAAGPLVAFAQPALFLALVASPWPTVSGVIADASMPPSAIRTSLGLPLCQGAMAANAASMPSTRHGRASGRPARSRDSIATTGRRPSRASAGIAKPHKAMTATSAPCSSARGAGVLTANSAIGTRRCTSTRSSSKAMASPSTVAASARYKVSQHNSITTARRVRQRVLRMATVPSCSSAYPAAASAMPMAASITLANAARLRKRSAWVKAARISGRALRGSCTLSPRRSCKPSR